MRGRRQPHRARVRGRGRERRGGRQPRRRIARVLGRQDRLRLRRRPERAGTARTSPEPPPARRASRIRTSTPASPRMPARRRSAGSPRTTSARGPWTAASSSRSRSSAPHAGASPLVTNVEDTVYADSAGRVALANSAGFRGSYEESQCYAYAYAFAGEGEDLMTGMAVGVARGPDGTRSRGDRHRGGRPRGLAARRTAAGQPSMPRGARPLRGRELRLGDRQDAFRGRRPARPLALRGQGGRADRGPPRPPGGRRPRARRPRDGALRRGGNSPAAHPADRGRHAARVPL